MPKNTGEVLRRFEKVIVPELNMGQLSKLIRSEFLIETVSINCVRGLPFSSTELESELEELIP
jgi:2-oxoglutarate ferredoxin oxidoreductase subunit alpha